MSSRIFHSKWVVEGKRGEWYVRHIITDDREGPFKTRVEAIGKKHGFDCEDAVAWSADGSQHYR